MGMKIAATGALAAGEDSPILYRGKYTDMIREMAEDGYKEVEMHILDSDEINREELWNALHKNGMRLASIGTGSVYEARHYNLGDRNPDIRKKTIRHLENHMITAGPDKALIIIGLIAGRFSDADSPKEFKENLTESLYQLDNLAEKHDIRLGFEIMNSFESDYLTTIDAGIDYFKRHTFRRISMHLDSVHMNIEESDIGAAIRRAGKMTGHVHIADNDRYYPGHGHINFREILQALYEADYNGVLALEINNRPDSRTSARKSLGYLNFLLNEIEGKN